MADVLIRLKEPFNDSKSQLEEQGCKIQSVLLSRWVLVLPGDYSIEEISRWEFVEVVEEDEFLC